MDKGGLQSVTGEPKIVRIPPRRASTERASVFAQRLKKLVLDACDGSKLSRMTFMATGRSVNNWFWGILEPTRKAKWAAKRARRRFHRQRRLHAELARGPSGRVAPPVNDQNSLRISSEKSRSLFSYFFKQEQ